MTTFADDPQNNGGIIAVCIALADPAEAVQSPTDYFRCLRSWSNKKKFGKRLFFYFKSGIAKMAISLSSLDALLLDHSKSVHVSFTRRNWGFDFLWPRWTSRIVGFFEGFYVSCWACWLTQKPVDRLILFLFLKYFKLRGQGWSIPSQLL